MHDSLELVLEKLSQFAWKFVVVVRGKSLFKFQSANTWPKMFNFQARSAPCQVELLEF